jgi:type I restriction enzyme S subunit
MGINVFPFQKLGDLCLKIGSGVTPRGGSEVYLEKGDVAFIRSQNIQNVQFTKTGLVYLQKIHADQLSNVSVEEGDVLLNITGDSVARCCQVELTILPARVNQHVAIIRPNGKKLSSEFLKYFLVSPGMQQFMLGLAGAGATRSALTKSMIESFKIPVPDIKEQRRIAHILGTLDDKIELNRQMNETLEAMAQALFKSWFVDFDPVIDKAFAAGKAIPEPLQEKAALRQALDNQRKPLPSKIDSLFPDEFVESELGWIPKWWVITSLSNLTTELRRGISPKYCEEEGIRVVNQRCIRNHEINWNCARRHDTTKKKINERLLQTGDLLINSTGVGTLGRMAPVIDLEEPAVADSHITIVRPDPKIYEPFLFARLMLTLEPLVESMGEGSTGQTELNRSNLGKLVVVVPPKAIQEVVEGYFRGFFEQVSVNCRNIQTLSVLRDTLLPKLISGEIRVPEAEAILAEAIHE